MNQTVALLVRLAIAAFVGTVCVVSPASAERRVALVIGNSAYQHTSPLDNPRNDANLMAETLRGLGFALVGNGAQVDLEPSEADDPRGLVWPLGFGGRRRRRSHLKPSTSIRWLLV